MPKKQKVHSLTGRIDDRLMHQAFRAVKRNRGAAGVDKVSIKMFEANLDDNLAALKGQLKTRGVYQPCPLRRKHIQKSPGKTRPLGIPAVRDRVAQEVVRRLLSPIFEPMDWQLHNAGYRFVRYADDFVVVCQTRAWAEEALTVVQRVVGELGLELSPEKTHITTYGKGYEFLGFVMTSRSRRMRPKSVKKFKDKIRELSIRHHNLDAQVIVRLNRVIRGAAQYFATNFATCRWQFQELDSWTRMRLRCMALKRKRRNDNGKLRVKYFRDQLGLLCLEDFCPGTPRYVT